jgi:DNA-binding CsgD family transcriptional regulator
MSKTAYLEFPSDKIELNENTENVFGKEEECVQQAFIEDLRTSIATEIEIEIWRRKNKLGFTHERIARDLGISIKTSENTINRLNNKLAHHLRKLRIRGSNFF